MQRAWIISAGTELTLGRTVDTNAAWLAARLAALGVRATRHITVADDLADTRSAFLEAADAADVVLMTGGLGPTDDDLTRAAAAQAAGVELVQHAPSVEHLRAFFAARGWKMPDRNLVQAQIPAGARVLLNTCGTAPGLCVQIHGTPCYILPGVPFEMKEMFERQVAGEIAAAATGAVLLTRIVHTFGLGESTVGEMVRDLMERGRNPEVGTTAAFGAIGVRIYATGATRDEAAARLAEDEAEVRRRLGTMVFGADDDTLASAVGAQLIATRRTLATAESCTGGMISAALTDVAGSSRYYLGGVVSYANEVKERTLGVSRALLEQHGAVSEPVAEAMATGIRAALGSDYGVAVTGIAGPTGGTADKPVGLVYVGLATPAGTQVRAYRFGTSSPRAVIRLRATYAALNLLRLALTENGRDPAHGSHAIDR